MTEQFIPDIPALEAAFHTVEARMRDLPVYNPALQVVAAGFRPWQGLWLGIMITPWAINLVLLPGGSPDWQPLGVDEHRVWVFPSGEYAFMGMHLEGFGPLQFCSLFSPALEFGNQDAAVAAARAALESLMTQHVVPAAAAEPEPLSAEDSVPLAERSVSRRNFLRGRLFGG